MNQAHEVLAELELNLTAGDLQQAAMPENGNGEPFVGEIPSK